MDIVLLIEMNYFHRELFYESDGRFILVNCIKSPLEISLNSQSSLTEM